MSKVRVPEAYIGKDFNALVRQKKICEATVEAELCEDITHCKNCIFDSRNLIDFIRTENNNATLSING